MNASVTENETVFLKSEYSLKSWKKIDSISVPNRAMNFGDGLFETMVFDGSEIRFGSFHWERLSRGLTILRMDSNVEDFRDLISFLKDCFVGQTLQIRWNLFRKGSGKYSPNSSETIQTLQVSRFFSAPEIKNSAFISEKIKLFPTQWSAYKTLNSLPYILANLERQEKRMDEVILLDYRGFLSEAGSSNIFWRKGDKYFTPALSCSCLDGVARRVILDDFQERNKPVEEGEFLPNILLAADQVFVSNINGISYLAEIQGCSFSVSSMFYSPI